MPGENIPCVVLQYRIFLCVKYTKKLTDNLTHHVYHILRKHKSFPQQFVLTAPNFREDINNNVTLHLLLLPVLLTPCQILLLPLALLFWMLGRWGTQTPTCTEPLHFSPQRTFSPWHSISQFYSQILHTNQDTKMGSGEQLYLRIVESCQPESEHSQEVWYSRMDEQGERVGSL